MTEVPIRPACRASEEKRKRERDGAPLGIPSHVFFLISLFLSLFFFSFVYTSDVFERMWPSQNEIRREYKSWCVIAVVSASYGSTSVAGTRENSMTTFV